LSLWRQTRPFIVGHRGGRGPDWPPENTLAAFERAAREGAPAIELDVRTCATGHVVVAHDPDLGRVTGNERRAYVHDLSVGEIRRVRLGPEAEPMPTLDDALSWAVERGVAVNVELKHDVPSWKRLVSAVARVVGQHRADVVVSSFHPALLVGLGAIARRVPRALLTRKGQGLSGDLAHALALPGLLSAVHVERVELDPSSFARFRTRKLRIGVWTVNEPGEASDLLAAGASYLITDCPAAIGHVVRARESWRTRT
jgi:glycerophosphoryl diester phosphodiesterase